LVDIDVEKKKIERMIKECEATESRRDLEKELDFFTHDAVYQRPSGKDEGIEAIREHFRGNIQSIVSSEHIPLRIEVSSSCDMAWVLGSYIVKFERDEGIVEDRGNWLAALIKVSGGWKYAALSTT
jgi:ketosteroid isomerase-like protein